MTERRFVTAWVPDWPVVAAGCDPDVPAAVLRANRVVARTPAAAADGVAVGMRRRQAQQRSPRIEVLADDPARDAREFESVVQAVAEIAPRLDVVEPGWIALGARGPSRYFGGDAALATHLTTLITETVQHSKPSAPSDDARRTDEATGLRGPGTPIVTGLRGPGTPITPSDDARRTDEAKGLRGPGTPIVTGLRGPGTPIVTGLRGPGTPIVTGVGVADGRFAAGIAARMAVRRRAPVVVEPGGSPAFCAELPIGWLATLGEADGELVDLFGRLGLRRLGDLAALDPADVLGRFGPAGAHARRLATGEDLRLPSTTDPAPERRLDRLLDDPAAQTDAVVFVAKQLADELAASLAVGGRVCTRLVVLLETEHGERSERSWYRSAGLSASAMVDRVRWQLDGWVNLPRGAAQEITSGVVFVRLTPEEVRPDEGVQLGLWGGQSDADRRAVRTIARLTTMTAESAVTVPEWNGGRLPAERYRWTPASWVDLDERRPDPSRPTGPRSDEEPWPGSLPPPSPTTVLAEQRPVEVLDEHGAPVTVSGRGAVSSSPATLRLLVGDADEGWRRGPERRITGWAGPWPVDQHWWDPARHRRLARFQVVSVDAGGADERADLVVAEHRRWWLAASY